MLMDISVGQNWKKNKDWWLQIQKKTLSFDWDVRPKFKKKSLLLWISKKWAPNLENAIVPVCSKLDPFVLFFLTSMCRLCIFKWSLLLMLLFLLYCWFSCSKFTLFFSFFILDELKFPDQIGLKEKDPKVYKAKREKLYGDERFARPGKSAWITILRLNWSAGKIHLKCSKQKDKEKSFSDGRFSMPGQVRPDKSGNSIWILHNPVEDLRNI